MIPPYRCKHQAQHYAHFRNKHTYEVLGVGAWAGSAVLMHANYHASQNSDVVAYRDVTTGKLYFRPVDEWSQLMILDDGTAVHRFTLLA